MPTYMGYSDMKSKLSKINAVGPLQQRMVKSVIRSKPAIQKEDLLKVLQGQAAASLHPIPLFVFELLQFSLLPSYASLFRACKQEYLINLAELRINNYMQLLMFI